LIFAGKTTPSGFAEINVAEGEPPPRTIVDCGCFHPARLTCNCASLRAFRGNSDISGRGLFSNALITTVLIPDE